MLLAAMLAAAALDAAPAPPPPASQPAEPPKKKPEMVCRKEEILGTRFKKTVCETKEHQEMRRAEDRKALEHIQNQTGLAPGL